MVTDIHTRLLGRPVAFPVAESRLAYWLVVLRLVVGWWFLHAGLDKFLAWPFDASWFVGGAAAQTSLGPVVTLFADGALLAFTGNRGESPAVHGGDESDKCYPTESYSTPGIVL
jgi:thiosulfate dehydrogenase [quinone] large subunit